MAPKQILYLTLAAITVLGSWNAQDIISSLGETKRARIEADKEVALEKIEEEGRVALVEQIVQ